jgi:hypothetical protein
MLWGGGINKSNDDKIKENIKILKTLGIKDEGIYSPKIAKAKQILSFFYPDINIILDNQPSFNLIKDDKDDNKRVLRLTFFKNETKICKVSRKILGSRRVDVQDTEEDTGRKIPSNSLILRILNMRIIIPLKQDDELLTKIKKWKTEHSTILNQESVAIKNILREDFLSKMVISGEGKSFEYRGVQFPIIAFGLSTNTDMNILKPHENELKEYFQEYDKILEYEPHDTKSSKENIYELYLYIPKTNANPSPTS